MEISQQDPILNKVYDRDIPHPPSTKYRAIKSNQLNKKGGLDILCTMCTTFDQNNIVAVKKVMMEYDKRNELYRCPVCKKVVSERTVHYYLNIELPQYIYYDKSTDGDNKKDIETVLEERERQERFVIQANNDTAPMDAFKRRVAKVIK